MSHARRQILEAFSSALTIQSELHRSYALPRESAPYALIEWGSEQVERQHIMGSCEQSRTLEVMVHLVATGTTDVAGILEAAAVTAETELFSANIGDKLHLTGNELTLDDSGERPVGNLSMSYSVVYRVDANDPETIL